MMIMTAQEDSLYDVCLRVAGNIPREVRLQTAAGVMFSLRHLRSYVVL